MDGAEAGPISGEAANKAAAWCEYLESHVRRIYGLVSDVGQQAAVRLSSKLLSGKLRDGFTSRDVYRHGWHFLNTKELAQSGCDELVDAGWLKPNLIGGQGIGRTPLPTYDINPKIKINRDALVEGTDKTD